jgi:UDP-N-acetylglucosamine 4,6-dehydratase
MKVVDLANAILPGCTFKKIGIRPGEKIHETLISEDEARKTKFFKSRYVILPQFFDSSAIHKKYARFPWVPKQFAYRSDNNDSWLTVRELRKMISIV